MTNALLIRIITETFQLILGFKDYVSLESNYQTKVLNKHGWVVYIFFHVSLRLKRPPLLQRRGKRVRQYFQELATFFVMKERERKDELSPPLFPTKHNRNNKGHILLLQQ